MGRSACLNPCKVKGALRAGEGARVGSEGCRRERRMEREREDERHDGARENTVCTRVY